MTNAPTSYDEVPYESFPFADTHPDRLATLARLFGLQPPPLKNCRVLELGCAGGGNLIPMALTMPDAQFVGIDLSAVQVAQGQQVIAELGLTNIRLLAMSITDVDESLGQFDFILTHGVYSWVPDTVQDKILSICARQLSSNGIAYISYNTLPGWHMRGMVRDAMRYHATQFADPVQRVAQARATLDFLARWVPADNNAYGMLLKSELDILRNAQDYYILHEHLEDINEPIYFHEFAARAACHGLHYLAEANFSSMLASNFPEQVHDTLVRISDDVVRQEQFMDFLRNRTFRQTLLVHDATPIVRSLTPDCVKPLWPSANLIPVNPNLNLTSQQEELFKRANGGMLRTPNAVTKAAMVVLARCWPAAMAFSALSAAVVQLLGQATQMSSRPDLSAEAVLASDLLQCYTAGLIELHTGPSPFVSQPGERPKATSLARWQTAHGIRQIANLRHEVITLEADQGRFLQLLDGTRSREEICRAAQGLALAGTASTDATGLSQEQVDQLLIQMARCALLQA